MRVQIFDLGNEQSYPESRAYVSKLDTGFRRYDEESRMSRIASIQLELPTSQILSQEVEHEREAAILELLKNNTFMLKDFDEGPYDIHLSLVESRFVFKATSQASGKERQLILPVQALRSIMKDYFLVCESYFDAIKSGNCTKVEAIDMGRRGLHDEASERLQELLEDKVEVDFATARRLFTLICVASIKSINRQ